MTPDYKGEETISSSVPLRHTIASSALATQHSLKWLDGVSDALAYALRWLQNCVLPPLRPYARALRLPETTRLRFALHGAQRLKGLEYSSSSGEGVIIVNWGPILVGKVMIMLAGSVHTRKKLELELRKRLW